MMDTTGEMEGKRILGSGKKVECSKTYEAIGHNAVQAFQRLHVFVGEEKLNHARVSEEVA